MFKRLARKGRQLVLVAALAAAVFDPAGAAAPTTGGDGLHEVLFLPEAEEKLAIGEAGAAATLYRDAFQTASGFEERLALMAPLARAFLVNQELDALLDAPAGGRGEERIDEWERAMFQTTVLQLLQDLTAASQELLAAAPAAAPELIRGQAALWAEEAGDVAASLVLARASFRENPGPETHREYLDALLEAGAEEELIGHVEARRAVLRAEAGLWRSLLPDLAGRGLLRPVAGYLEEAWRGAGDASVAFALAELRVFQGKMNEAAALFWTIFEMEEAASPASGALYFQRLNQFFHNRFAVKNRLGRATGRYGTEMCREFLFLGLREDFDISDVGAARDLSLLYLRALSPSGAEEGERFLHRVENALDRAERPPGQRVLAFAGIGAPAPMLDEIASFVDSGVRDAAAAEFSLRAMNRYVLSTEKFPELRDRMGALAPAMSGKFPKATPPLVRNRSEQMEAQIIRRLGLGETGEEAVAAEPGSPEDYHRRIATAAREGDPEEAERLYRELVAREGGAGEGLPDVLLFLASAWQERDPARGAVLVAEYLEPLYSRHGDEWQPAPLHWFGTERFSPPESYLDQADLEVLYHVFENVAESPVWDAIPEALVEQRRSLEADLKPGACLVQVTLHWWAGEAGAATSAARSCAEESEEPELKFLLAQLLGLQGDYAEASEVLGKIQLDAGGSGERARRLLFAFAVASGDSAEAAGRARELRALSLNATDKARIAFGLVRVGLYPEAEEWIEASDLKELERPDAELYQRVWLQMRLHRGENDRAASLARLALMKEIPDGFASDLDPARREALEVLEAMGRLDAYQGELRQLLKFAPRGRAILLLLGESADYRWQRASAASEAGEAAREEAVASYGRAADSRPLDIDLHLELCQWLVDREQWSEAVERFQELLEVDAPSALLGSDTLFKAYRRAGKLPLLVDFLEEWQVPEAGSMDDFYGLQPTEHIFRPLGEALLEEGERWEAIRAWTKGLQVNPIAFTERMRLALAEVHRAEGEAEALLQLVRGYVVEENVDPHFYAVQPFASAVPRWIARLKDSADPAAAPVERLIGLATKSAGEDQLLAAAGAWEAEAPGRLSSAVFKVYLSSRLDRPGWKEEFAELKERFAAKSGPRKVAWEAVETVFDRREEKPGAAEASKW